MSTEEKQFNKTAIYFEEERYKKTIEAARKKIDDFNIIIDKVEGMLGKNFSESDIVNFIANKKEFVVNHYRPDFPFESAADEFNLQAIGVNIEPILKVVEVAPSISYITYKIENCRVVLSEEYINSTKEGCTTYTKNEKQNKAFKVAEKAVKHLNELHDMGVISKFGMNQIDNATTNIIHVPRGLPRYEINHYGILAIK